MPKRTDIKSILVIGSGPIIIGQAAEFDYAGTQACRELKKEGLEVVLINSNPATIMTDKNMADKIYIEPLTVETVKKIINIEKHQNKFFYYLNFLGGEIIMARSNQKVVPEAKAALDKFKYEVASEVGVNLKQGYNGDLSSKDAGRVGGNMVRKLIQQAENNMK